MGKPKMTLDEARKMAAERAEADAAREPVKVPHPPRVAKHVRFLPAVATAIAKLKEARQVAGLTLAELSKRTGIPATTLSLLENGTTRNPTWKLLGDYAHAIGGRLTLGVEGLGEQLFDAENLEEDEETGLE